MSVIVVNILQIDVVGGFFRTRFILERRWLDSQLSYQNLNSDDMLNLMSLEEEESIWFPSVMAVNVASPDDDEVRLRNSSRCKSGDFVPIISPDIPVTTETPQMEQKPAVD